MKLFVKFSLFSLFLTGVLCSCQMKEDKVIELTDYRVVVEAKGVNSPAGEGVQKLVDSDKYSKFLTFTPEAVVNLKAIKSCKLKSYALISGNDSPERDPKEWILRGSVDGKTWKAIDRKGNIEFLKRNEKIEINIENCDMYKYYQFQFKNNKGDILQLSEIELYGSWDSSDETPIAGFSVENSIFFDKGSVNFTAEAENAKTYKWTFEGGTPSSSNKENPVVTYSKHGKYDVTLEVSHGDLKDVIVKKNTVIVKRRGGWDSFEYPEINFVNETIKGNGALYQKLVPKPKELIRKVCLDVCKLLYRSVDEVDVLKKFDYLIQDTETISAKSGNPPHISIFFSSSYVKKKFAELGKKKIMSEIEGVLYHEITHGYQYSPKGAGAYASGTDFFSLLEGVADCVRYQAGYFTLDSRKAGGHWTSGYRTTGFFIDWLCAKDKDFLYKLNQTAKTIVPWSWDAAIGEILSVKTQKLWDEYQLFLKNK